MTTIFIILWVAYALRGTVVFLSLDGHIAARIAVAALWPLREAFHDLPRTISK